MLLKQELSGRTAYFVGGSSAVLFAGTFVQSYFNSSEDDKA